LSSKSSGDQRILSTRHRCKEWLVPSKRKKVVPDPNSVFVNIEQIHQAQIEAGRIEESSAEESNSERSESKASCIVVG
jgi:hypothetical protein